MIVRITATVDTEDFPGVFDLDHESGFSSEGFDQIMEVADHGLDVPRFKDLADDIQVERA